MPSDPLLSLSLCDSFFYCVLAVGSTLIAFFWTDDSRYFFTRVSTPLALIIRLITAYNVTDSTTIRATVIATIILLLLPLPAPTTTTIALSS